MAGERLREENSSKVVIGVYYYQYHRKGNSRQLSGTMERGGSVGSREHLSFQETVETIHGEQHPDGSHLQAEGNFPAVNTHGGSPQTGTTSRGNSRQLLKMAGERLQGRK